MKIARVAFIGLQILKAIYEIKALRKRIPLYCEWEVTSHCNMGCNFCSTWIPNRNEAIDFTREGSLNIIEQLAKLGTKIIHFSGGEPTLREDLPELIMRAKERNMMVFLTTNGSASSEKLEGILSADLIRVSIDGTEQFHDTLRNTPGAFKKAMETLRFLKENNAHIEITTVYSPQTSYGMLDELGHISKALNIQLSINVLCRNINDNLANKDREGLGDLRSPFFTGYIKTVEALRKKYSKVITHPQPYITIIKQGGLNIFGCRAMDIAIAIKHDGSVSLPCNGLSLSHTKGDLHQIYYGRQAQEIRPLQGRHPACKGCYIRCMCLASSLLKVKCLAAMVYSYLSTPS